LAFSVLGLGIAIGLPAYAWFLYVASGSRQVLLVAEIMPLTLSLPILVLVYAYRRWGTSIFPSK